MKQKLVANVLSVPIQSVTTRLGGPKGGEQMSDGEGSGDDFQQVKEVKKEKITKTKEVVFLIKNGKAKKVDVETGLSDDNYIAVLKGLEGGEDVVSGSYKAISRELNDDMQVRVEEKRSNITKK